MFCDQGCSLRDSLIPPKSLNRPIISNKYLDMGCKCLGYHFDILLLVSNTVYDKNFAGEKFHQRLMLCIGTKISPNLISPTVRALGRKYSGWFSLNKIFANDRHWRN